MGLPGRLVGVSRNKSINYSIFAGCFFPPDGRNRFINNNGTPDESPLPRKAGNGGPFQGPLPGPASAPGEFITKLNDFGANSAIGPDVNCQSSPLPEEGVGGAAIH